MKHHLRFVTNVAALGIIFGAAALVASTVSAAEPVQLFNPLQGTVDPNAPIQSLSALFINTLFGIAGAVALAMYVWGGALWLGSAGEEKMVTKGKAVFQWTTLGVIMMFSAYTLVSYLFGSFGTGAVGGATGGTGAGAGSAAAGTPGAAAVTSEVCCVDYATSKSSTKPNSAACTGTSSKYFPGKCADLKFCGADSQAVGTFPCMGVLTSCGSGVTAYPSFENCMINQKAAAGVGASGAKPAAPKAITQTAACKKISGQCIDLMETGCVPGNLVFGKCSGGDSIVCCTKVAP